jgi:hypothetical protein
MGNGFKLEKLLNLFRALKKMREREREREIESEIVGRRERKVMLEMISRETNFVTLKQTLRMHTN